MRVKSIFNLMSVYNQFLLKKVLNTGVLRNVLFRLYLGIIVAIVFTFMLLGIYQFLGNINDDALYYYLLDSYTMAVITWSFVVFLVVRYLFLASKEFKKMTYVLPVTAKERNLGFVYYEMMISLVFTFLLASAFIFAMVLRRGDLITEIFLNSMFTGVTSYLVLMLLYQFLNFLLQHIKKLVGYSEYILFIMFTFLFLGYIKYSEFLIMELSQAFISKQPFNHIFFLWENIFERIGIFGTIAVFILHIGLVFGLISKIPIKEGTDNRKQVTFTSVKNNTIFISYMLSIIRDQLFIRNAIIAYAIFGMLVATGGQDSAIYGMFILVSQGIYQFDKTKWIRLKLWENNFKPLDDYFWLLFSQIVLVVAVSIPAVIILLVMRVADLTMLGNFLNMLLFGHIAATTVGILFPTYESNPFSPLISVGIITFSGIFGMLVLLFLNLTPIQMVISMLTLSVVLVFVGVQAISRSKGVAQNAKTY